MNIAVIGAGLMGRAAAYDLIRAESIQKVGLYDVNAELARDIGHRYTAGKAVCDQLDAGDEDRVADELRDYSAAISCVPYKFNAGLTRAAIKAGCHLVDLGGNNDVVLQQLKMDEEARQVDIVVVPDCGLAPGMVAILAVDGMARFDRVRSLQIRVGGLPQKPRPPLDYQMVFAAEGLINEYSEPCIILEDGKKTTVAPMTGLEELEFDDIGRLEAFYTSGGASTLPDTFEGRLESLDYKTVRYPGHCHLFKAMLDLGFGSREPVKIGGREIQPRTVFRAVLDRSLSFGEPDLTVVRLTFRGEKDGAERSVIYEIVDRQDPESGLTAMMRTTAFPAAIVAWMAAAGQIKVRGVKPQEVAVQPGLFLLQLAKRNIRLEIRDE